MHTKFKHISKLKVMAIAAALLACIVSCSGPLDIEFNSNLSHPQQQRPDGATLKDTPNERRVFVLFSFGYNNLSYDLNEDIEEMITGISQKNSLQTGDSYTLQAAVHAAALYR